MSLASKNLTEREKAAICMHFLTGCNDWVKLYTIAEDKPIKEAEKTNYINSLASRWKTSPKVQNYLSELQRQKAENEIRLADEIRDKERQKIYDECVRTESNKPEGKKRLVDYSDPKEQQRKLNELVNTAQDQKEALDALKTIIATQKDDRDAAKERKTVTAYLPLLCYQCPLYLKAQEKQPKKGTI